MPDPPFAEPDPFELLKMMAPTGTSSGDLRLIEESLAAFLDRVDSAPDDEDPEHTVRLRDGNVSVARDAAAKWALSRACNGWRRERICRDGSGRVLAEPHPACLRAQATFEYILQASPDDEQRSEPVQKPGT